MAEKIKNYVAPLFFSGVIFPALLKYFNIFFIDLRQQEVLNSPGYTNSSLLTAAGIALLLPCLSFELMRRSGRSVKEFFYANFPLAGIGLLWFTDINFFMLFYILALTAWSVGRTFSLGRFAEIPQLSPRKALGILGVLVLLFASLGFWQQMRSMNTMSMSWFDWGHFYECLNNFFYGKPFHLNLCGGSFLGVRFSPSLILLLPVVATGSVPLFLFTGSLLVCSGALFVYLISRSLKSTVNEAFGAAVLYFFIPGVANMNLPLIDGFHEVFMLFPLVLGTVWLALEKRYILAGILFLLSLGVRETSGVIFAGYGVVLFCRGHRRSGAALFAVSLLYVFAALKVFMPLFDTAGNTYVHVKYFSHLGNDMAEIALSPIRKPGVFFSSLFSQHNFVFWVTLFLPFILLAVQAWPLLLPLLPELVMLSVDRRYDTQSVLRHYQISLVLVLIVAALAGAAKLRRKGCPQWLRYIFCGLGNADFRSGVLAATAAAVVISSFYFVHLPGLPCAEPQRRYEAAENIPLWEDARPVIQKIRSIIPRGAAVTSGARLASMLLPDYRIFFDFDVEESKLQDHVLIENTTSFYFPEDKLSRRLLLSPNWDLVLQEFIDERSVQLFRRRSTPLAKVRPLFKLSPQQWNRCGMLIPGVSSDLQIRGAVIAPGQLRFGVQLQKKRDCDAGFRVELQLGSGQKVKHFITFGNGRFPADLADPGETFFFVVNYPPAENVTMCRVTVVDLRGMQAPM